MTIPWGIIAISIIGAGVLWLMVDAQKSVGRLRAEKKQAKADLKQIEVANEAERIVDSLPAGTRRDRLREWISE